MSFRTRRWHIPSRNHEPSWEKLRFARSLYQSLSQFGQKNYRNVFVPCHDTMPSFNTFISVLDLQELKNQVSQSFRTSHDAHMFEFHSHFLQETYKFTQRHTCDFSTNFGALEHVLVVQIWIMHIKFPKTQLIHKNAERTRNNSKFKHDTHVLVACSLYVNVLAIQTPSFPSVTPFCLSKHNEINQVYHKQFTINNRVGCDIK